MDAITVYSENYIKLYEKWINTLPEGFDPIVLKFETNKKEFGFRSDSWYDAIYFQLISVLRILENKPNDEVILVSDIDILFIRKDSTLINLVNEKFNNNPDLEMWISREDLSNHVNTGFYFLKNNYKTKKFIIDCIKTCRQLPLADQTYFNINLNANLNWDYIPNDYAIWATKIYNKDLALFYHAVQTYNVEQKLHQQETVLSILK